MLNEDNLQELRRNVAEERTLLEETILLLAELKTALEEQETALARYEATQNSLRVSPSVQALLRLLHVPDGTVTVPQPRRKTNVQVFEELLLEHGQPMHATDIAIQAETRGVVFQGSKPREIQARNALANSKRFVNQGGNMWWVANVALLMPDSPQQQSNYHPNGHHTVDEQSTPSRIRLPLA